MPTASSDASKHRQPYEQRTNGSYPRNILEPRAEKDEQEVAKALVGGVVVVDEVQVNQGQSTDRQGRLVFLPQWAG